MGQLVLMDELLHEEDGGREVEHGGVCDGGMEEGQEEGVLLGTEQLG